MTPYVFQRGETISLALDAVTGDPLIVTALTATMKALAPGRTYVDNTAPVAASFEITPRAALGDNPAGWNLTIAAGVCAGLSAGAYLADAKITAGSGIIITDSVAIRIQPSVTA